MAYAGPAEALPARVAAQRMVTGVAAVTPPERVACSADEVLRVGVWQFDRHAHEWCVGCVRWR